MKKTAIRILVIVLAAALLLGILLPAISALASDKITQGDIDKIQDELDEIAEQKKDVQAKLNSVRGDMSKAKEQVELIQSQITLLEYEISVSLRLMDKYDLEIQEKEYLIEDLEDQEEEQYREFCSHVRWMEETGSVNYLSILFRASSFSELLDYLTLIADIMAYSNKIISNLNETRESAAEARDELQIARDAQKSAHEELKAQREELDAAKEEAEEAYALIAEEEAEIAAQAQQLARDEAQITKELQEAELKYAEQIGALQNSGSWFWPLPGIYHISSIFGGRYHPITGRWESHTGTDIPAPGGTEIHAAQGGIVTTVGTNRYHSYGYYCIISHGNGKATLYAHMRSVPIVSVGQSVDKGQVIGYVGTTGSSTGNHLHFELRVNGERQNVLTLYPNLPYTGPYVSLIKKQLGQ